MNRRHEQALPPALTQYFDPPEGHVGEFGWVCGYSADAAVLDAALERFTGQTHAVRANEGSIAIALVLDPGNEQITPVDVPGLLHLPYIEMAVRPFRLMHAKVGLLGFRHEHTEAFVLRLVVSTGNWTFDTLERSIDLVWQAHVSSDELADPDQAVQTACADIAAAANFFTTLRGWFDDGLLSRLPPEHAARSTTLRYQRLKQWLSRVSSRAEGPCRFMDNRKQSLLAQLPERVGEIAGATKRNRLLMGSGFFESSRGGDQPVAPGLASIVDSLHKGGLLTRDAQLSVFANRETCQSLRDSSWPLYEGRWRRQPERTLHAKFIFSGFEQSRSDSCGSAWLYLGSGNLTGPGFLHRAHPDKGNLEAGVVLGTPDLEWTALPDRLPVATDKKLAASDIPDAPNEADERATLFVAAPVHAFIAIVNEAGTRLLPQPLDAAAVFDLLDADGATCRGEGNVFVWNGAVPRMLDVIWRNGDEVRRARVPVLDEFGRVAGAELPALTLDDAWDELASFPIAIEDPGAGEGPEQAGSGPPMQPATTPSRYTVRRAMELVERIAAAQCDLPETEWTRWCLRLEQTLARAAECETVLSLPSLGYNVLSPLLEPAFRPDFARLGVADRVYREALAKVAVAWCLHDLPNLELQG